jgi:hypothetical protein
MPCFYNSPNPNASTKPENILFTKAELGSHVLCMRPLQWQDQYNMSKKGMMLMDMRLLLTLLKAIPSTLCDVAPWPTPTPSMPQRVWPTLMDNAPWPTLSLLCPWKNLYGQWRKYIRII